MGIQSLGHHRITFATTFLINYFRLNFCATTFIIKDSRVLAIPRGIVAKACLQTDRQSSAKSPQ